MTENGKAIGEGEHSVETLLGWSLVQWKELANDRAVRRGLDWCRTHRVSHLNLHGDGLTATLTEGAKGEPECWVTVRVDDENSATIQYGPDQQASFEDQWGAAIAAVLAYQASKPVDARLVRSLADVMRQERVSRARHGVDVHPPADGIWGVWRAASLDRKGPTVKPYRVHLRALDDDINGCTCPDFDHNQLGTCKHIEAVKLRVRTNKEEQGSHPLVTPYLRLNAAETPGVQIPARYLDSIQERTAHWTDTYPAEVSEGPAGVTRIEWPGLPTDEFLNEVSRWATHPDTSIGPDLHARMEALADEKLRAQQITTRRHELATLTSTPDFLSVTLYPYQVEGIQHLGALGRGILADDMGLGKTLQAIGAMRYLMLRGDVSQTLIIAPTSLLGQWKNEIEKFTGLSAVILSGSAANRIELLQRRPPIAITSYDRMIRDFAGIRHYYRPDLVIADEAQRFKNWQTKAAAYIKAINAPFRFALTGTPMENRLLELYSVVQFVDSTVLGAMWRFVQEYHVTDMRGEPVRPRNVGLLRDRLSGILLRRERALVADQLPDRQDIRLLAPLDPIQRDFHDAAVATIEKLGAIMRKRPLNPREKKRMQSAITSARMACNCAGLIDKTSLTSPKLEIYRELIEQLCVDNDRKVVVFSAWVRMGELAVLHARNIGVAALQLHGGVKAERRQQMIEEFANNPDIGVLVCSDTGSTGLNLQMASALIHLDMPWTPAIHDQRSARIFRLGQKSDCLVYTLLGEDSYELHVEATVNNKARIFAAVVGDGDASMFDEPVETNSNDTEAAIAPSTNTTVNEELDTLVEIDADTASELEGSYDDDDMFLFFDEDEDEDEDDHYAATSETGGAPSHAERPATERPASPSVQPRSAVTSVVSTSGAQGVRDAGRPRLNTDINAHFEQLERVAPAMRAPADALWRAGNRRFAAEMLVRGESLKACAAVGDAMPSGWEALTEWWQLRAAAQGFVSVERALVLAQACAMLGLPDEMFDTVVDDAFWTGLLG